ncbi:MAG TPA: hypothetical protein VFE39_16910 [Pseudonocardia sp.]|nr:hypothetical protein [Pseudonocardia sp.]
MTSNDELLLALRAAARALSSNRSIRDLDRRSRASSGELLYLPVVYVRQRILAIRARWADPRVARNLAVTHGVHVRPILVDP